MLQLLGQRVCLCLAVLGLWGCAQPAHHAAPPAFCGQANSDALAQLDRDELLSAYQTLSQCSNECAGAMRQSCNGTLSALSGAIDSLYQAKVAMLSPTVSRTPGYVLRNLRQLVDDIEPLYLRIEQEQRRASEGTPELARIRQLSAEARHRIPLLEVEKSESAKRYEQDARIAIRDGDFLAARHNLDLMFENDPRAEINQVVKRELVDAVEADIRRSGEQAERLLSELARLTKSVTPSAAQKARAEVVVQQLNHTLGKALAESPGDERLVNISTNVKIVANKQSLARLGAKDEIEEPPETSRIAPARLLANARQDLGMGKLDDARSQARIVLQANSSASAALWAEAQVIIGVCHAMNIPDNAPDSPRGRESRQLARNEFGRALAASPKTTLPPEFSKFRPIFEEARRTHT